ncbi:hypothetical protein JTB14_005877 [Gonioctena quinquepunctata]|nr:hypothetical protein JTB14_005877 [Gonioctena quinquepunctata]
MLMEVMLKHYRLNSRMSHLFGRFYRIPDGIKNGTPNYKGDNVVGVSVLLDDLEMARDCHVRGGMQGGSSSSQGGAVEETPTQSKVIPVNKWGIIFDGFAAKITFSNQLFIFLKESLGNGIVHGFDMIDLATGMSYKYVCVKIYCLQTMMINSGKKFNILLREKIKKLLLHFHHGESFHLFS